MRKFPHGFFGRKGPAALPGIAPSGREFQEGLKPQGVSIPVNGAKTIVGHEVIRHCCAAESGSRLCPVTGYRCTERQCISHRLYSNRSNLTSCPSSWRSCEGARRLTPSRIMVYLYRLGSAPGLGSLPQNYGVELPKSQKKRHDRKNILATSKRSPYRTIFSVAVAEFQGSVPRGSS